MGLLLISCSKDDDDNVDYAAVDKQKIQEYLAEKGLTEVTKEHSSGLFYQITEPGIGQYTAPPGGFVTVKYTGMFLDETVFEGPNTIPGSLNGYIKAWQIGIPMLKEGGKAMLYCPSHLAYGKAGSRSIPPNTPLIFEVKLIDFQ